MNKDNCLSARMCCHLLAGTLSTLRLAGLGRLLDSYKIR